MSAPTTTNAVSSSPKRSWRRFTLRALFLVVLAAGIFFGWVAYRVREFNEQATLIAELQNRGFRLTVEAIPNQWLWEPLVGDHAVQVCEAYLMTFDATTRTYSGPTAEEIDRIARWESLESLVIGGRGVTDSSLREIQRLWRLRLLRLEQSDITDEGATLISALTNLNELIIDNASPSPRPRSEPLVPLKITSKGLHEIVTLPHLTRLFLGPAHFDDNDLAMIVDHLPNLERLRLSGTQITNEGLVQLSRLRNLTALNLSDNPRITDDGIKHLCALKQLDSIYLHRTGVTPKGAKELATALTAFSRKYSEAWTELLGVTPFDIPIGSENPFGATNN